MNPYLAIFILLLVAGGITALMYAFSVFFGPKNMSHPDKSLPFECGSKPIGEAWSRFPIKFYLVAVLFVIFDIEVVFLYPWATRFRDLGTYGLISMAIFVGILTIGLIYVWKKGVFEWH
jgi:NADH-quinone oxidoreductase subunit A